MEPLKTQNNFTTKASSTWWISCFSLFICSACESCTICVWLLLWEAPLLEAAILDLWSLVCSGSLWHSCSRGKVWSRRSLGSEWISGMNKWLNQFINKCKCPTISIRKKSWKIKPRKDWVNSRQYERWELSFLLSYSD